MSYLKRRTEVPWGALALQFGANYSSTRYFKRSFNQQLRKVLVVYPEATVEEGVYGLVPQAVRPPLSSGSRRREPYPQNTVVIPSYPRINGPR